MPKDQADAHDELNQRAVEHAKKAEYRTKIKKKLEEHIKKLNEDKRELSQKFNSVVQMIQMFQSDFVAMGQTIPNFEKASAQQSSQTQQGISQVLDSLVKKESSFIDSSQQNAAQYQQAADAAASGYGQITQTRS